MSWQQVQLGEVADIISGATPKSTVPDYWGGEIAWATPTDLSNLKAKHIASTERRITDAGLKSCSARLLPPNSVLFSSRAPIGLVAINRTPMATNQGFKSFVPSEDLNADYLYWWLLANKQQIQDLGNGATFKEVSKGIVSNVKIPLPPVDEQRRIAAILDKADAIRRKRQQALALADDFLKSVFLEMFGDPLLNTKKYKKKPLSEFGEITTGSTPPRANPENYGNDIEWIKSDNINTDEHYLTSATEGLSQQGMTIGRVVPQGSILITCIAGSPSSIGKVAIANRAVAFNQQINAITPNPDVDLLFLYAHFLVGKALVQSASTNSMKGMVSKGALKRVEFLCPDYPEQKRFGRVFEKSIENLRLLTQAFDQSENMFSSLSQRAFRGEL